MRNNWKILVLVALILLVTLSACERAAARPSVTTPTGASGELPFPVGTQDLSAIGTATAIASTPLPVLPTATPQVLLATETPGAQPAGSDQQPTATTDPNAGGGVTSQPAAAAATPVVERPATYTIMPGEFPYCIARRFNVDPGSLLSVNGLGTNSNVAAGANLKIPTGTWNTSAYGSRSLKSHPVDYTVVAGDSVYEIACKFGDVTPEAILAVNNISAGDIKAGMTLRIP